MKPEGKGGAKKERVEIDFSKVEIEPLFEEEVDFDTFSKSDFRAVKIKSCEEVKKSDKLLKFVLNDGSGEDRVILSGIKKYYDPSELVGKTAIEIVNRPLSLSRYSKMSSPHLTIFIRRNEVSKNTDEDIRNLCKVNCVKTEQNFWHLHKFTFEKPASKLQFVNLCNSCQFRSEITHNL